MRKILLAVAALAALLTALAFLPAYAASGAVKAPLPPGPGPTKTVKMTPAKVPGLPHTSLPGAHAANAALISDNWSGYAVQTCGTCALRYVQTQYNIPSLNCTATPDAYESNWAGLDGLASPTVEQTGTLGFCDGGVPYYYAWYEAFPQAAQYFMGVNPGDAINVSVFYNGTTHLYDTSLTDISTGGVLQAALTCGAATCENNSAEVITEAPASTEGILPLADFGEVNYTDSLVTSRNGTHGNLAKGVLWNSDVITMEDQGGNVLSGTSLLEGGQAFYNEWVASS